MKSDVVIAKSFSNCLAHSKNKEDLFGLLAEILAKRNLPVGKKGLHLERRGNWFA